ncbi:MAG: DUF7033 domain-containing protein [Chitinophagaceae bacterium]
MLIFVQHTSSRLLYVLQFIESVIHEKIEVTTNAQYFNESNAVKINYSNTSFSEVAYHIQPHTLLFETSIHSINILVTNCRGNQCFFQNETDNHGFDIFAAIFYLITRYEEYLPHEKDMYGRYAHTNSLAYQNNFLQTPLVNYWIKDLQEQLHKVFPQFSIRNNHFLFIPTYDIDIAFAHQFQPIYKKVYRFFRAFIKGNVDAIIEQSQLISQQKKDPFDVYDWLDDLHKKYFLQPIYFYLLATNNGLYDKNVLPSNQHFRQFLAHQSRSKIVGIHPSWQSGDSVMSLKNELQAFAEIVGKKATLSRQHYIRMELPKTYETLIEHGIEQDFSMGYGSVNGFRASVAAPFYWFNIANNEATNLQIMPFCFMEANAYFEEKLSVEEAFTQLLKMFREVECVNGMVITIFHNHFLTTQPQWIAWRKMYEQFLQQTFSKTSD